MKHLGHLHRIVAWGTRLVLYLWLGSLVHSAGGTEPGVEARAGNGGIGAGAEVQAQPPLQSQPQAQSSMATLDPHDLVEFATQPAEVQQLIIDALALTQENLAYRYGSDDPKNGGMDCSGTVAYLLKKEGINGVPREASAFYTWTRTEGLFQAVNSTDPHTFELNQLHPGDLLFWVGTYAVVRDPPITHVMIYLGTERRRGQRVMMGASEGRRYAKVARYGVSVFDFNLPGFPPPASYQAGTARFIGYAPVPGLRAEGVRSVALAPSF